jgi:hypothetical protein
MPSHNVCSAPKADIVQRGGNVRFVPIADSCTAANDSATIAEAGIEMVTALVASPAELDKLVVESTEKWGKVIRAAGIKAE